LEKEKFTAQSSELLRKAQKRKKKLGIFKKSYLDENDTWRTV
jgi:hypothetical protein